MQTLRQSKMRQLLIFSFLSILPIVLGKFNIAIKQVVNNEEVPVKSLTLSTRLGDNLEFRCYLNMTFRNNSFLHNAVEWSTPSYSTTVKKNQSSNVIIPKMSWFDEGEYACSSKRHKVRQTFYLMIDTSYYFKQNSDITKFFETDNNILKYENIDFQPNLTDIVIPDIYYNVSSYSYTDKGHIFFIPAIIVIILGIVRMCYYLRHRSNVSWERLRSASCRHQLCIHRRRTDPAATCLLQSTRSSGLSIVIVGAVNGNNTENPVSEADRPPAYNEVIPQDLPPTYNEAIETTDEVPSDQART